MCVRSRFAARLAKPPKVCCRNRGLPRPTRLAATSDVGVGAHSFAIVRTSGRARHHVARLQFAASSGPDGQIAGLFLPMGSPDDTSP